MLSWDSPSFDCRDGGWHAPRMVNTYCLLGHSILGCIKAYLIGCEVVGDDIRHGQQQNVRLKVVVRQTHTLHNCQADLSSKNCPKAACSGSVLASSNKSHTDRAAEAKSLAKTTSCTCPASHSMINE